MSKDIPGNNRHLSLADRHIIEAELKSKTSLRQIAILLCKDPTTISKEIKLHRQFRAVQFTQWNKCIYRRHCKQQNICKDKTNCNRICSACRYKRCNAVCKEFKRGICEMTMRAPFVCNGCEKKTGCKDDKYFYQADFAHKAYEAERRESRLGINSTPEEISNLNEIISKGVKNGQSIAHIYHANNSLIPCSEKTIYNYIDGGYFGVKNLDLPRKLRYKKRKNNKQTQEQRIAALNGRRYSNFVEFVSKNDVSVVEMDTVFGAQGTGKVLLTMNILSCSLLLAFLLDSCNQTQILKIFDALEVIIGPTTFRKVFTVVLTDRGVEFLHANELERSVQSKRGKRTKIFYCDPNAPFQKGRIEKAHTHIRSFFPKKSSFSSGTLNNFDGMTQERITLMINHINSLKRDSLGGRSPMELALDILPNKMIEALGLKLIPANEVYITPTLLR